MKEVNKKQRSVVYSSSCAPISSSLHALSF